MVQFIRLRRAGNVDGVVGSKAGGPILPTSWVHYRNRIACMDTGVSAPSLPFESRAVREFASSLGKRPRLSRHATERRSRTQTGPGTSAIWCGVQVLRNADIPKKERFI